VHMSHGRWFVSKIAHYCLLLPQLMQTGQIASKTEPPGDPRTQTESHTHRACPWSLFALWFNSEYVVSFSFTFVQGRENCKFIPPAHMRGCRHPTTRTRCTMEYIDHGAHDANISSIHYACRMITDFTLPLHQQNYRSEFHRAHVRLVASEHHQSDSTE